MFFVKLELSRKTTSGKIEFGRRVISKLTDNVNFPNVEPPLDDIAIATNELEIAMINAHNGDKEKISIRNEKEKIWDKLISQLSMYVQLASKGVKSDILSSGMDVVKKREPVGMLRPPGTLNAVKGAEVGSINLKWSAVYGAKSYVVEMTSSPAIAESYRQVGISTAAKLSVTDLDRGTDYWFRVAALGAAGLSDFSAPVTMMAT